MLTASDIKFLYQLCEKSPQLPQPPKTLPLVTGNGVIVESAARDRIRRIICEDDDDGPFRLMLTVPSVTPGRTTIFEIAELVRVDANSVERLLPVEKEEWGRVGPSTVVRRPEFLRLRDELKEQVSKGVVTVSDFCKLNQIDWDLFLKILPPNDGSWAWLEDMSHAYGVQFAHNVEDEVLQKLQDAQSPINFSGVFPLHSSSTSFQRRILTNLITAGRLKGTIGNGKFTPESYVIQRQTAVIQELQSEGIIALEAIQKEGVRDPLAFVHTKLPDAVLLGEHLVTPVFIAHMESIILDQIERQGWGDVKDPEQRLSSAEETKLRAIISKNLPDVQLVADRLVPRELSGSLQEKATKFANTRAEAMWKRKASSGSPTLSWGELSKHLNSECSLPPAVMSYFMTSLHPYSLTVFSGRLEALRQQESRASKDAFVNKFVLRFMVYLQGARSIADKSLRSKLEGDLCQFAKETGLSGIEKLESVFVDDPTATLEQLHILQALLKDVGEQNSAALHLDKIETGIRDALKSIEMSFPNDDEILAAKTSLVSEMASKLQTASDLSLQMLLVVLLAHAKTSTGVLKASGKYVPKLLKELQSKGALDDTQFALLSKAKAAVTGKGQITDQDVEGLKAIGAKVAAQ